MNKRELAKIYKENHLCKMCGKKLDDTVDIRPCGDYYVKCVKCRENDMLQQFKSRTGNNLPRTVEPRKTVWNCSAENDASCVIRPCFTAESTLNARSVRSAWGNLNRSSARVSISASIRPAISASGRCSTVIITAVRAYAEQDRRTAAVCGIRRKGEQSNGLRS